MIDINATYQTAQNVVAREVEGELIIVPLSSGVGDLTSKMYALNLTGAAVWEKLDGQTPLQGIIEEIAMEYNGPLDQMKTDILDLAEDLLRKKLIIKIGREM